MTANPTPPTLVDPREKVRCACPRLDASDCIEFRSNRIAFDEDDRRTFDTFEHEECECSCHDRDEDDHDR